MNYLYQLFTSFIVDIISFALSLFIAKKIGAVTFGQYSTALAIGSILVIVFDGGMRTLLICERTKASDHLIKLQHEFPHTTIGYSVVLALIASVIYLITFSEHSNLSLAIIWCFWGVVIN